MYFSRLFSIASNGSRSEVITIETDVVRGLYHFSIVGLPDKSIEESRERICAAIKNSGFESPKTKHHKITSSLVPAHIKKIGSSFDLPIALSYLTAIKTIHKNEESESSVFIAELSLDGIVRPIQGILPMILHAISKRFTSIFISSENKQEALIVFRKYPSVKIYIPQNLREVVSHLNKERPLKPIVKGSFADEEKHSSNSNDEIKNSIDFRDIQGQEIAKRAALIAMAGGHNLLLIGTPGTGKTLIAKACRDILPPPDEEEVLHIAAIHSFTGNILPNMRPFRAPHHTSSYSAMIGGTNGSQPGEISLAHKGILFLDEFPEFDRRVIESLREPLEEGTIKIARVKTRRTFPADILLIAAANPCPCGFRGAEGKKCLCTSTDILRYRKKISGPILDRIDLVVRMSDQSMIDKEHSKGRQTSRELKMIISQSRTTQESRSMEHGSMKFLNARIPFERIYELTRPDEKSLKVLEEGTAKLSLSIRGQHRILRVARTIADLEGSEKIKTPHILEALSFRMKEF